MICIPTGLGCLSGQCVLPDRALSVTGGGRDVARIGLVRCGRDG